MNNFFSSELRLVKAPDSVGEVVSGQPLLFQYWRNQVAVFEEPTIYLSEKVISAGRSPSKNTWEAAGYDLLTWFQWCQLTEIDWREATEADRRQFADDYAASSDSRTVNRKLTVVRRFYDFCGAEGWYHRDIGSSLEQTWGGNRPIDEDDLAHTRSSRTVKKTDPLLSRVSWNTVVRPIQLAHLRKLLRHLGPDPEDKEDKRLVRDRLMVELALYGGARLGDVINLTTLKFLSITVEPHQMLVEFPLIVIGKRQVTRQIALPGWLVVAVQKYIDGERLESERLAKKKMRAKPTTALFLGHPGSKAAGKPISRSAVQKMFELACRKCGIVESIEVADPETGISHIKTGALHSFHDLRHSYAVLTYHAEKARGNKEPWKIVQIKLGHKSVKVTTDVYLSHVEIFGEKQGLTDIRRLIGL